MNLLLLVLLMAFDPHANLAYSTVATAPSPAASGTSLTVQAGDGAKFPAVSFNALVWPAGANPLTTNAEIVRVTVISTDTFTITRMQEGTSARSIVIGDQICAVISKKTFTDIEGLFPVTNANLAQMPAYTIKANNTDATATAADVTVANIALIIPMRGEVDGMTLANNGAGTQSISIAAGVITDSTQAYLMGNTVSFYKSLSGTWVAGAGTSGSPKNGLDTGSVAASTWYHVYAIFNPTSGLTDYIFSTAAPSTGPSLPTGYTVFQRIGSVRTDGAKNVTAFFQDLNLFLWGTAINDVAGVVLNNTSALYTLSIPPNVRFEWVGCVAALTNAGGNLSIGLRSPDTADPALAGAEGAVATQVNGVYNFLASTCHTNTSQQIRARSNGQIDQLYLTTRGWIDPRGRQ